MKQWIVATVSFVFLAGSTTPVVRADEASEKKINKPIKMMLSYALRKKDEKALEYVGGDTMSRYLLDKHYEKATPAQRDKFKYLTLENIRLRGFPMIQKYFKSVDVPLGTPEVKGKTAKVESTIIWSGAERTKFQWVLTQEGADYRVTDIINSSGESSMEKNKDRVQKSIEEKGMDGFLKQFEAQVEKMKKEG